MALEKINNIADAEFFNEKSLIIIEVMGTYHTYCSKLNIVKNTANIKIKQRISTNGEILLESDMTFFLPVNSKNITNANISNVSSYKAWQIEMLLIYLIPYIILLGVIVSFIKNKNNSLIYIFIEIYN